MILVIWSPPHAHEDNPARHLQADAEHRLRKLAQTQAAMTASVLELEQQRRASRASVEEVALQAQAQVWVLGQGGSGGRDPGRNVYTRGGT